MAPERYFGDTYQNVFVTFAENRQESERGQLEGDRVGVVWTAQLHYLPQINGLPVTDLLRRSVSQLWMPGTRDSHSPG